MPIKYGRTKFKKDRGYQFRYYIVYVFLDRALPLVESLLQSISTYCFYILSVIVEVTSRFNVVIHIHFKYW